MAERGKGQIAGADTARRALRVLESLAATGSARSLEEVGEAVGLNKSTVYRLLRMLQEEGYVDRGEPGGYMIGNRFAGLIAAVLPQLDLYSAVRPHLRELVERSGETVTLHRRAGDLAVLVLAEESTEHVLRRMARIGEVTPLYRGASGQSILAFLEPGDRVSFVDRAVPEDARKDLESELADVRAKGFSISFAANHEGVSGMSAPIRSTAGSRSAVSVSISGPEARWTETRMTSFADQLIEISERISDLFSHEGLPKEAPNGRNTHA